MSVIDPPRRLTASLALRLAAVGAASRAPKIIPHPIPDLAAKPVVLPPLKGASAPEIRVLVKKMTVFFLCDDSGSMYGGWGDPTGIRYAAALSLLKLMHSSGGGRGAVIHWGTNAPPEMAVGPFNVKSDRKALAMALTIPPTLGGNDLPAALRLARQLTPKLDQDEQVVYYVLTDGIEPVTSAMHSAVGALPAGSVHMVLVDRSGGCNAALETAWKSVAFGSFTRLQTFDTERMARQIGETFARSAGLELPEK